MIECDNRKGGSVTTTTNTTEVKCKQNSNNCSFCDRKSKECCFNLDFVKKLCSSDQFHLRQRKASTTVNFPRSEGLEMSLPQSSSLAYDSDSGQKPALRIIKIEKKKNVGDVDLNKFKKKKANNWKIKKDNLKKMVNLDLLSGSRNRKQTKYAYDQEREIHVQDNTDDELFLKIESGSVSTINSEVSSRSKLENKLKNTKDKYMKYQNKAINKIKSFIPKSRSNENIKFMTASDISKSRTLVAEDRKQMKSSPIKPPRPPLPKNYQPNKTTMLLLPTSAKPPIRPARSKSKKSSTKSTAITSSQIAKKDSLPASVYYRQLREKWLEKHTSKSNLSSICSSSIPNCSDRKYSFSTNQSLFGDDFRYRFRADFQSNLMLENAAAAAAERQSIKSEPTYALAPDLPPRPPIRKRLTVSSYLGGSSLSLHRRINSEYFNSKTDKSEQATDPLFWKPYSFKTNRVRSLTELYLRKNQSPQNSHPDHLQRTLDKLNQIYCMPKRPPLPVRYKKRVQQQNVTNAPQTTDESIYRNTKLEMVNQMRNDKKDYLNVSNNKNEFTNLPEIYTVRDALVGPNAASYGEKEIQTSLEDFQDLDYYDDEYPFESSPRFIDSSTNDEFESLAKTRNLSDNEQHSGRKIKKQLEKSSSIKLDIEEPIIEKPIIEKPVSEKRSAIEHQINKSNDDRQLLVEEPPIVRITVQPLGTVDSEQVELKPETQMITSDEKEHVNEETLNEDYVTLRDSSSKTIGSYKDAHQGNTLTNDDKQEQQSNYVTMEYDDQDPFDTDTLADLDSLNDASYLTPINGGSLSNTINKPKRTKRRSQLRNSGLDTEDDEDDITDEIIGIAANLQKELKQLVEKQN